MKPTDEQLWVHHTFPMFSSMYSCLLLQKMKPNRILRWHEIGTKKYVLGEDSKPAGGMEYNSEFFQYQTRLINPTYTIDQTTQ